MPRANRNSLNPPSDVRQGFPGPGYRPDGTERKNLVLCFDGTGNKFQGTSADSNILKIYRMLDREDGGFHYYQPGIGTYVTTMSLSHTSMTARLNSWYQKAKDSAIGSSFDEHVMGAYTFLMRYYSPGDDIFFFGFSRGSYTARFLAEMLDHVGLLSAGNEELIRFAWKTFAQWQQRKGKGPKEEDKKNQMFEFMRGFRETFMNSVPRFENAWMQRSKFPYTARSSAKVIRHAVAIDERRAKFRQDLISQTSVSGPHRHHDDHLRYGRTETGQEQQQNQDDQLTIPEAPERFRRPSQARLLHGNELNPRYRRSSQRAHSRSISPGKVERKRPDNDLGSINTASSQVSLQPSNRALERDEDSDDEEAVQDIEEIWFPGCHADIGGGWPLSADEECPLSHGPLVWMVREAQKAGLQFDYEKMRRLQCHDDDFDMFSAMPKDTQGANHGLDIPEVQVTGNPGSENGPLFAQGSSDEKARPEQPSTNTPNSTFLQALHVAATKGKLHDCLEYNNGLPMTSVLSWRIMEYLPFRRMDLQPDGSWKSISWPLPKGEVRDIPENAWIHHSAIRRMEHDENYRPGNLIIGGGGRGIKKAPKKYGIGQWEVLKEKGNTIGETFIRKGPSPDARM
ncbi:Domain of unknown function DUF2235 [Lasallia pustulata]|uniref:T6SS Phospholipase effector Tle1-like catalytic domain-containing protein n=1 Tax=Lasallia pustulata TaxID=136370 RepID=A0A1W5CWD3_9LECA|nr:Domain of unknown function DUF2235 [Lasallia pustulata]